MNKELSANTTLSHYRIVSKIGAGAMGEVYLAEDTRLDCKVALKLLPAEFTHNSERVRRFMQEAKAASALNHPNIITVYHIGEEEAGRFHRHGTAASSRTHRLWLSRQSCSKMISQAQSTS